MGPWYGMTHTIVSPAHSELVPAVPLSDGIMLLLPPSRAARRVRPVHETVIGSEGVSPVTYKRTRSHVTYYRENQAGSVASIAWRTIHSLRRRKHRLLCAARHDSLDLPVHRPLYSRR